MAVKSFLFLALLSVAYANYALVGGLGGHGYLAPHSSGSVLSCAAKFVDHVVLKEIEHCANGVPLGLSTGVLGMHGSGSNHLVTMTKTEISGSYGCVAQSGNRAAQDQLRYVCTPKRPAQIRALFGICLDKVVGARGYAFFDTVAVKPFLHSEIYECIQANFHGLSHVEAQQQVAYEQCVRRVKAETC